MRLKAIDLVHPLQFTCHEISDPGTEEVQKLTEVMLYLAGQLMYGPKFFWLRNYDQFQGL